MPKALGMVYTKEGSGKPVLLLHGWGASKESFYYQIQHLKKKFTVIAVDFWGFGESDKLKKPYTVFDYALKLHCFLQYIDVEPYAVIAHSFGARVLLKGCLDVEKIVITGGAGLQPRRSVKYYVKKYTYRFLKSTRMFHPEKLRRRFSASGYAELDDIMRKTFSNVVAEDLTSYLCKIKSPTLLVWGENDRETPLYMAKRMERGIESSALVVIDGAGHFPFVDRPNLFNGILDHFL